MTATQEHPAERVFDWAHDEYADPESGLTYDLHPLPVGNTYDPPRGADWFRCPLCARSRCDDAHPEAWRGTLAALRGHLGDVHNVRVTDQHITITVGRTFSDRGGVVRYVDDRPEEYR
ncbi:hypothetical protein [uncultured Jatrophihabitans sp.]|uniref:hypothetical protein n=1 Tax=uncultured Jatrophihabitans sp. TaxID=1610747 RepID=UPI0035CAF324